MRRKPPTTTPPTSEPGKPLSGTEPAGNAFDSWLQRRLHEKFDAVAAEPVPEDLLKLLRGGGKPPPRGH